MIYKAVFHIDLDDEKRLQIGLNNVANLLKAISGKPHDLVMLFNGPAVNGIVEKNCVNHMTKILELQEQNVTFQVCQNALNAFEIDAKDLVPGCVVVPAGIVALIELQNEGYGYIKP